MHSCISFLFLKTNKNKKFLDFQNEENIHVFRNSKINTVDDLLDSRNNHISYRNNANTPNSNNNNNNYNNGYRSYSNNQPDLVNDYKLNHDYLANVRNLTTKSSSKNLL